MTSVIADVVAQSRKIVDDMREASEEWSRRLSLPMHMFRAEPAKEEVPHQNSAEAAPTAGRWRAEESARWLDETERWRFTGESPAPEPRAAAAEEVTMAVEAATSRLRRSLLLQEARRREAEAETELGDDEEGTAMAADETKLPAAAAPGHSTDGAASVAAAARHAAAADARAAALEVELAATRRRVEETLVEIAAAEQLAQAAASAQASTRPAQHDETQNMCVVCLEHERTHVLVPCGHRCLCGRCAARYETHLRFDSAVECDNTKDTDDTLKGKKPAWTGGGGRAQPTSRRSLTDGGQHSCPLCRKAVTGVHLVWE